jgi:hypothetical protein
VAGARTVDGSVSVGTFNFSSTRARRDRAKEIGERVRSRAALDFIAMLEEVCQRVLKAERRGEPAIMLRDVARPDPDDEYDVCGFRFPKHHGTIIFGDGGTAKSYHALYIGGVLAHPIGECRRLRRTWRISSTVFCQWQVRPEPKQRWRPVVSAASQCGSGQRRFAADQVRSRVTTA